jgi:hypothetical protein
MASIKIPTDPLYSISSLIAVKRHLNKAIKYSVSMSTQIIYERSQRLASSRGPVHEFVCISFRTDNLNCFGAS